MNIILLRLPHFSFFSISLFVEQLGFYAPQLMSFVRHFMRITSGLLTPDHFNLSVLSSSFLTIFNYENDTTREIIIFIASYLLHHLTYSLSKWSSRYPNRFRCISMCSFCGILMSCWRCYEDLLNMKMLCWRRDAPGWTWTNDMSVSLGTDRDYIQGRRRDLWLC